MNNDYLFDEEVDQEAAAELERQRAEEAQRKAAAEAYQKSAEYSSKDNTDNPYQNPNYNNQNPYGNGGFNNGQNNNPGNGQYYSNQNNGGPYYNGPYYSGPNYNGPSYSRPGGKKMGTGPATASFILGVVSLVLFCSCINLITAIIAIILGITYLKSYDLRQGKARAITGIVTAAISIVMLIGSYSMMSSNENLEKLFEDDIIQFYYDNGNGSFGDYEQYFNEFEGHNSIIDNTL